MVDAERLVSAWLRAQAEVTAVVGPRVFVGLVPAGQAFPLVTVERIGGVPHPGPLHLDRARLQIDAWGRGSTASPVPSGRAQVRDLAALVQALLHERLPGRHELGVVTAVEEDLGLSWSPDPEDGRDRFLFGVTVFTHP